MHSIEPQGFRIACDDEGDGDPIVLLHGFADDDRRSHRLMSGRMRLLRNAGFRVIAPDARAHGRGNTATGSPTPLAESIPGATAVIAAARSHLSCITHSLSKDAAMGLSG